jgi:hypothetical protein
MSVLASIEPAELQVDPGAETSLTVRVRNRGSIVDRFDIAVVGPMAPWTTVEPASLRLFPEVEGEARVTFRPPRASNPAADSYPFGVSVRAASNPDDSTVEEGRVTVGTFVDLAMEIVPQTSRGSRSGSHELTIHNLGNAVAQVSVRASDPDRLLRFEVLPQRAGLRPDGKATMRAKVKPKDTFFTGPAKRIPFTVSVDEPIAGSFQVPATLEQRAIIPGWAKIFAGLAVAGIAAIAFLPGLLGGNAGESAEPSLVAQASPTSEITEAPPTASLGEPSVAPTPEVFGPPDNLVAAGDEAGLNPDMGLAFKCPPNDPCRNGIKVRIQQVLDNLELKASGAQLLSVSTTVAGTLPLTASWDNRYKYQAAGVESFAKSIAIDLAPKLGGKPAYILIQDENQTLHWYTIPDATADLLLIDMYVLPAPAPTTDPNSGSGGVVLYRDFYTTALYNGLLLQTIQFAATPPP